MSSGERSGLPARARVAADAHPQPGASAAATVGRAELLRVRLGLVLPPVLTGLLVLALWETGLLHRILGLETYTLAYPSAMWEVVRDQFDLLLFHLQVTMAAAVTGYVLGSATGYVVALILSQSPGFQRYVLPVVSGLMSMPVIAVAPLMVLYLGSGIPSKVAVVALMTLPPMAVMAYKGLVSVDVESRDLLRSYAATRRDQLLRLACPISLPYAFTALRLNVTLSLVGAIIAEFVSAVHGLGLFMKRALASFDMPRAWTAMVLVGIIGIAWYQLVTVIERLTIPWHESVRDIEGPTP